MGPNRLVAWQRRAGMSRHVCIVAHMEKIDMVDRCGVSAHSCDVVSHKVRPARWRLPRETGRLVCLKFFVFVTERWRETRSALVFEDFITFRRCRRSGTLGRRRGPWRRETPSPIVFDGGAEVRRRKDVRRSREVVAGKTRWSRRGARSLPSLPPF